MQDGDSRVTPRDPGPPFVYSEAEGEVSEEAQGPRRLPTPLLPSQEEVDEHNVLGHVQYRTWCPYCVACRAVGQRHTAVKETASEKPQIFCDYGYMNGAGSDEANRQEEAGGEVDEANLPILVLKDKRSGTLSASLVPAKGRDPFAVKFFRGFIEMMGHPEFVSRSDGERGIVALKAEAAKETGKTAIPVESPVGDSQSNGEAEAAVKEVKSIVRTVKMALESNLGRRLGTKDPILAWIPTYAADMISRHRIGPDGCTPHKRRTGRNWNRVAFQLGEMIFVKTATTKAERRRQGSYHPVMREGRYLGHHSRTGSLLVMTDKGVVVGTGARRVPEERRWTLDGWDNLRGLPWDVQPAEKEVTLKDLVSGADAHMNLLPRVEAGEPQDRRRYVTRADIDKFGETDGCPGCASIRTYGRTTVAHNDACRERVEKLLKESDEGRERLETHRRKKREKGLADDLTIPQKTRKVEQESSSSGLAGSSVRPVAVDGPERPAEAASSSTDPPARPDRSSDESARRRAEKREAPESIGEVARREDQQRGEEEIRRDDGPGVASTHTYVDLEDLVRNPSEGLDAPDTDMTILDVGSLEALDEGILGPNKVELYGAMASFIRDSFAAKAVDVSGEEVRDIATLCLELGAVDLAEVYSPGRFGEAAWRHGLRPGFAVDLQTGWNMDLQEHVETLREVQEEQDPYIVMGSPPCTEFSRLLHISKSKRDPDVVARKRAAGERHLRNSVEVYRRQMARGRYFLHEHPKSADSWQEECIRKLEEEPSVVRVSGPMCRWGMEAADRRESPPRTGLVLKETSWLTNSPVLARILEGTCSNKTGGEIWHRHVQLIGGLAAGAARYPPRLVEAVLKGVKEQMQSDGHLSALEARVAGPVAEEPLITDAGEEAY